MAPLRVIGAGFGRTGTLSMKRALEELGFGPTYHMEEVFRHPSHVKKWHRFATTGQVDWDDLFDSFGSAVDFPASCAWRELAGAYPDAKVILTVRDPERWWQSTATTIYPAREMIPRWLRRCVPLARQFVEMNDRLIWQGLFDGRFNDRSYAISAFEQHRAAVRATIEPDRLLVFDVKDGWGPLCEFLEVPPPRHPFPALNDAAAFRRRVAAIRIGTRAAPVVAGAAAVAVLTKQLNARPVVKEPRTAGVPSDDLG